MRISIVHGQCAYKNTRTNDVYAQDPVGLFLTQEFDGTFGVHVGLRTGVGSEGEFANVVLDAVGFEILLSSSDPGNFRVGVDDGWNGGVVDVTVA